MMPVKKPATTNHIATNPYDDRADRQHVRPDILLRVRTKVWLETDSDFVIGEGGLELLAGIIRSGSLTKAAREIGWSYRHAWGYLRHAEKVLSARLATSKPGKGMRRGMILTDAGLMLFERLSAIRQEIHAAAEMSYQPNET